MRLDKKAIGEKDGGGYAVVVPEVDEDLWHAYNLICVGDQVRTSTLRKVVKEGLGGSTQSKRVSTQLTLEVEAIHFDPSAPSLQLRGKNVAENKHVRVRVCPASHRCGMRARITAAPLHCLLSFSHAIAPVVVALACFPSDACSRTRLRWEPTTLWRLSSIGLSG